MISNTKPGTPRLYQGPRRRTRGSTVTAVIVDRAAKDAAVEDEFARRADETYDAPRWLAKRVLKRTWSFGGDAERLAICLAFLYPKGLTPFRWEIAFHCEQAVSITGLEPTEENLLVSLRRAADAAEDLFRRGYTIPADTIKICREADEDARKMFNATRKVATDDPSNP